jgi:hypothetical protein
MVKRRATSNSLPPLRAAEEALRRAALRARERARLTGTPLVVSENDKLVRLYLEASGKAKRATRRSPNA